MRKRREDEKKRPERKKGKKEIKEKIMGEMVGDQTANQAAKPLKKGEKQKQKQFWNSRIAGLVGFISLVSSPVCECLLGTLGTL
jgi:hypothetical protein